MFMRDNPYRYHAFLSVAMSFVGLLCGCLMAFPIFGQFVPKSVCLPEDFGDEINSKDVLYYHRNVFINLIDFISLLYYPKMNFIT